MSAVQYQLGNLDKANCKELGEAIDMIKDLEETIYYCSIVKAMEKEETPSTQVHYYTPVMNNPIGGWTPDSTSYDEGRSPKVRKMYMEHKKFQRDTEVQKKDLEKYITELTADIMEMIEDATLEEKEMLSKKISVLSDKIKH